MKQKNLKGFTLVELMIVIAIFSMLMLMISAFFKPIASLFKNVSDMDTQQTAADGINEYIASSVRFADNMYILTGFETLPTGIHRGGGTYQNIPDHFCEAAGLTTPADKARIRVIYVTNEIRTTGTYTPGAPVSAEMKGTSSLWSQEEFIGGAWVPGQYTGRVFASSGPTICDLNTTFASPALGHGYYGKNDFLIEFENNLTDTGAVKATDKNELRLRTSTLRHDATPTDSTDNAVENVTQNTVRFTNSDLSSCFRVIKYGDMDGARNMVSGGTPGTRTWIIYTLPVE